MKSLFQFVIRKSANTLSLEEAAKKEIEKFGSKSFSAFQITEGIRSAVNFGKYSIDPPLPQITLADKNQVFEVKHSEVRAVVESLTESKYNVTYNPNGYREFSLKAAGKPNTSNKILTAFNAAKNDQVILQTLRNSSGKTLKQVQSALHKVANPVPTCYELYLLAENNGIGISNRYDSPSKRKLL